MTVGDVPALAHDTSGGSHPVPMVLLHAFPLDRSMWDGVRARLGDDLGLIAVDLPGLGGSPLPAGEPSLTVSADAVAALLDRLGAPRAALAGVSMGGYVAMEFLRRHRDRLAGLALIDTRAEADDDDARAARLRVAEAVLGPQGTAALAAMPQALLGETTRRERPDLVDAVAAAVAAARPDGVAWSQRAMAARPDSTADLRTLAGDEVPVAVVVGEEDTLTPVASARAMTIAAGAELTVVPRAGHLAAVEDAAAVAAACSDLMLRVGRGGP